MRGPKRNVGEGESASHFLLTLRGEEGKKGVGGGNKTEGRDLDRPRVELGGGPWCLFYSNTEV